MRPITLNYNNCKCVVRFYLHAKPLVDFSIERSARQQRTVPNDGQLETDLLGGRARFSYYFYADEVALLFPR